MALMGVSWWKKLDLGQGFGAVFLGLSNILQFSFDEVHPAHAF